MPWGAPKIPKVLNSFLGVRVQPIVDYFEDNYIGRIRGRGNRARRGNPRFAINLWNVHQRTMEGGARTNNAVEGFLGVAKNHHGIFHKEKFVFYTGKSRIHTPFEHHYCLCFLYI